MADILIKNGHILTMDGPQINGGYVLIKGSTIVYVGTEEKDADTVIDAENCVVMPGLINAHTHIGMKPIKASDLPLWPDEHNSSGETTQEDCYNRTIQGCLDMIRTGTTAFADMNTHVECVANAVEDSGIRAALAYGMTDNGNISRADSELTEGKHFVRRLNGAAGGRITAMYAPHAPHTCSRKFLARVKEEAVTDDVRIHIHVLETEAELNLMKEQYGMCSVNMLDELGFLGPDVLAAHCIWLSEGDIGLLADRKVNVVHCPASNMKLGSGIAPVPGLMARGANVALGTNGCASHNDLDMFEEMKTTALLHNSMNPATLPANDIVKMATVHGAKALGIQAGILKPGMLADIIVVDTPQTDVISHLVYSTRGSDVRTVIVNGKVLMEDGMYRKSAVNEAA